jgi:hypothetical protein
VWVNDDEPVNDGHWVFNIGVTGSHRMIPGFEKIVEERIKKAQYKGEFNDLPGSGLPLDLTQETHVPEDLRLAYKMLKNAGCLPQEIELKKEVRCTEALLADMKDTAQRYRTLKKLNYLIMKLNACRDQDARFDVPQKYLSAVTDRIAPK